MNNNKRRFKELSKAEQDILHAIHDRMSISGNGPTTLARRVTGNSKLQPRDEAVQDCIHLIQEGWIVFEKFRNENIAVYKVSDDFSVLQPA